MGNQDTVCRQVTLYARELGVAVAHSAFVTGESYERAVLKALLSPLELVGVLIQADVLHTSPAFFSSSLSRSPTCSVSSLSIRECLGSLGGTS
jgi:hypothetical protein